MKEPGRLTTWTAATLVLLIMGAAYSAPISGVIMENEGEIRTEAQGAPMEAGDPEGMRSSNPKVKETVTLNAAWSAYRGGMGWNWHPQGMTWDPTDNVLVISLQGTSTLYKVTTAGQKTGESTFSHQHQTGVACDGTSYYVADYTGNNGNGPLVKNNRANGNNLLLNMHWYGGSPMVYADGHLYYGDPGQSAYNWGNMKTIKKATTNNPANALQTINTNIPIGDMAFDGRDIWILQHTYSRNSFATIHRMTLAGVIKETFTNIYRAGASQIPSGLAYANGNLYLFSYSEVQGQGSTLTTITGIGLTVYTESAALTDPTDEVNVCYAQYRPYTLAANITSSMDLNDASEFKIYLDYNTTNATLCYNWTRNEFFKLQDPGGHVWLLTDNCTVADDGKEKWWLNFSLVFNFTFPHEEPVDCFVNTTAVNGESTGDRFPGLFRVENDMELAGAPKFVGEYQGVLEKNDWIRGGENISISNFTVVYAGSSGISPHDDFFDVRVTDMGGNTWWDNESCGEDVWIDITSRNVTDIDEEYNLEIVKIPDSGVCMTNLTFPLRIDNEAPLAPANLLCRADGFDDKDTEYTDANVMYVTWDEVVDPDSGLTGYYYSDSNNSGTADGNFTLTREIEIADLTEGYIPMYVWCVDNVGNIGRAAGSGILVDLSPPVFANLAPVDGGWHNHTDVECSMEISDGEGSGVDGNSIEYSVSADGINNFNMWVPARLSQSEGGFRPVVTYNFAEGVENYIIWRAKDLSGNGYVESAPVNVKVDITPIEFAGEPVRTEDWYDQKEITTKIMVSDTGIGVDPDTLMARTSTSGPGGFGEWVKIEGNNIKSMGNGEYEITATFTYDEGRGNYIMFRGTDLVGNAAAMSDKFNYKVDTKKVYFDGFTPDNQTYSNEREVECFISIFDDGSGVNANSVEYSLSHKGMNEKDFGPWKKPLNVVPGNPTQIMMDMEFEWGRDNYIRWRADDNLGTGVNVSEIYNIWVNSEPSAIITSPRSTMELWSHEEVEFDASMSADDDGDELEFFWTSNVSANRSLGAEAAFSAKLAPGKHMITLFVSDGHDYNVSEKVSVDVKVKNGGGNGGGGGEGGGTEKTEKSSGSGGFLIYLILGGIVILLTILLVIFLAVRRKRRAEEKETALQREPMRRGMYPAQGHLSPQAQFPSVPQSYGPPQQQQYQAFPPVSAQQPALPPIGIQPQQPALPPTTPRQQHALPPTPRQQPALPQTSGQPMIQPQTASDQSGGTTYSLPAFSTDEGEQDLNLMALPPGPDPSELAQGTAAGDPFADIMNMQFPSITPGTQTLAGQLPPGPQLISPDTATPASPGTAPPMDLPTTPPASPGTAPLMDLPTTPPASSGTAPSASFGTAPPMDLLATPPQEPSDPIPPMAAPDTAGAPGAPSTPTPVQEEMSGPTKITMQCHACGNNYKAEVVQYPALVTCPVCMTQGVISGG